MEKRKMRWWTVVIHHRNGSTVLLMCNVPITVVRC